MYGVTRGSSSGQSCRRDAAIALVPHELISFPTGNRSSLAWFWSVPLPSFHFQINQPRALDQLIGNLNLDLPHKLGSATHLEYLTWSGLTDERSRFYDHLS